MFVGSPFSYLLISKKIINYIKNKDKFDIISCNNVFNPNVLSGSVSIKIVFIGIRKSDSTCIFCNMLHRYKKAFI